MMPPAINIHPVGDGNPYEPCELRLAPKEAGSKRTLQLDFQTSAGTCTRVTADAAQVAMLIATLAQYRDWTKGGKSDEQ